MVCFEHQKNSDGLGPLMTFSEGPDAHAQNIGRRGVEGGGYIFGGKSRVVVETPYFA